MIERTGLSLSALLRNAVLKTPPPRGSRRPPIEQQAIAQLLGALGRIGGNVNQIARHANMGREDLDIPKLKMALRDLAELRLSCLQVLGYEREYGDEP